MANEFPGQTLTATALVHEVFLRLSKPKVLHWRSEKHFLAAAAVAMRRILVDIARRKDSIRNGGGRLRIDNVVLPLSFFKDDALWVDDLADLDSAIAELELVRRDAAEFVKLRVFDGLSVEESATKWGYLLAPVVDIGILPKLG